MIKDLNIFKKSFFLFLIFSISNVFFIEVVAAENTFFSPNKRYKENEVLVKFINNPEIYKFTFASGVDIEEVILDYQNNSNVEYAELNHLYYISDFPNDPLYSNQSYLRNIQAKEAWSKKLLEEETAKTVYAPVIAIIDTGVDINHPDLKDNIWINSGEIPNDGIDNDNNGYIDDINGWDFVSDTFDPTPKFEPFYLNEAINHGTVVAGIAAARGHNNEGIAGVFWRAKIMPLRALDSEGVGTVLNVQRAIEYAVNNGADIINMSFVGFGFNQTIFEALKKAYEQNVVMVAAAGNTNAQFDGFDLDEIRNYPVCYKGTGGEDFVIGVTSLNENNKKSSFSNYGIDCIDVSAPGENFYSTTFYEPNKIEFKKYYSGGWSGTSVSAPVVAGTAALIKSLNKDLSNIEIRNLIVKNTDDIYNVNSEYKDKLGSGKLNLTKLTLAVLGGEKEETVSKPSGAKDYIVNGLGLKSIPQIKVNKLDSTLLDSFLAYSPNFSGPINVAAGDVDGDGLDEIITGAGAGGGPHVRIFDRFGNLKSHFFAYNSNSRNGINVAVGDVNGDGIAEIITGGGPGSSPLVRIFNREGHLISEFFAYHVNFSGGVNVAAGDFDGDGLDEIITGAGAGGGPHVRIFDKFGKVKSQFFAYNIYFNGGVKVAAGDVDGDKLDEIITGVEKNAVSSVKIFKFPTAFLNEFFAYAPNYFGGVNLNTGDIDNDGTSEIITGTNVGYAPHVRIFNQFGKLINQFFAYSESYRGGVRPALINH